MKITIIGSGAMGCLFGGLLTEHGQDVQLLDVKEEQVRVLNKNGLTVFHDGVKRLIRVRAVTDPAEIGDTDLALIFVKHAQTRTAAQVADRLLGSTGSVLTLQNGMGNAEIIADTVGEERVLCGTTAQGAMLLGLGKVQHSGTGATVVGMWKQERQPIAAQVADIFSASGIVSKAVGDIEPILWNKLFVNVGINALTALTSIRNGQLLDLKPTRELMKDVVQEAVTVAEVLSVPVTVDVLEHVENVARATASNRSSMGQDVDAQRLTEIDAINGYIVRKARELGIEVPVNQTLVRLVKTLQGHYGA
ncbi:MAG: 2-dehydropantoate 2-reductase [Candidatus Electrothrix sp. AR4]|nr:2-dehydropantoate 2-reductase [Candidatus Electrothrix sp. AR4]